MAERTRWGRLDAVVFRGQRRFRGKTSNKLGEQQQMADCLREQPGPGPTLRRCDMCGFAEGSGRRLGTRPALTLQDKATAACIWGNSAKEVKRHTGSWAGAPQPPGDSRCACWPNICVGAFSFQLPKRVLKGVRLLVKTVEHVGGRHLTMVPCCTSKLSPSLCASNVVGSAGDTGDKLINKRQGHLRITWWSRAL